MSRNLLSLTLLIAACDAADDQSPTDTDTDAVAPTGPDLTERLGPGQVRAGVLVDEAPLFGGVAAEGQPGDILVYNDRVRFVIQGVRDGSYYVDQGGGVIDADVVRPPGEPGRDVVDEWIPMIGAGRLAMAINVEVVNDGSDGNPAVVRVEGPEAPLALLEGAVESDRLIPDLGLLITHEYVLPPDSWLLEVRTTVEATDKTAKIAVSDLLFGAPERAWGYADGVGLAVPPSEAHRWAGYVGHEGDVAVAVLADADPFETSSLALIAELAEMAIASGEERTLEPGQQATWTRWWGVGPDLATLTDAAQARKEAPTDAVEGQVTAPDGPVAGARVAVLVDDRPFTEAVTDADGRFSAQVPQGADARAVAIGQGTGLFVDLPPGVGAWGPYAAPSVKDALAPTLGAPGAAAAVDGRGVGTEADPLTLGAPAKLVVEVDDDLPFTVLVRGPSPEVDGRLVSRRVSGAAAGFSRDGSVELLVAPGTYDVVVHRGPRFELHREEVTLDAGEHRLSATLPPAFEHDGWVLADPHSHASPSSDSQTAMEERLIIQAALGIQLHFGTDHDHMVDYNPLLAALGIDDVVRSVVADEVSPPLRGHFNIYPVVADPSAPNGGAWRWWREIPPSTDALMGFLRERHGDDFLIQANHPDSSGIQSMAGWRPGRVGKPSFWTDAFEVVEVLNAGGLDGYELYLDLTARGRKLAATGVSDSHGPMSGRQGFSATWLRTGTATPLEVDDDVLIETIRSGRTVVSRGVFLDLSVDPGATVPAGTEVEVRALTPSWYGVDRLILLRDGEEVERVDGDEAVFTLDPEADAVFVVIAEGDGTMAPVDDGRPWAMTSAIRVDVGGDGWTAPLPPTIVD